jgi:hypothetical protein
MTRPARPPLALFLLAISCATSAPSPDNSQSPPAADADLTRPPEAPAAGRSRFDLPGECSAKLGVAHGIADMAECEGPMGDTAAVDLEVKAILADADGLDARIQLVSGPPALADGTVHGSFSDGRPIEDGDLTFGRFSVDFGAGLQITGFVLRERSGGDSAWVFHITGGSGCLANARGELSLLERTRGTLKLSSVSLTACGHSSAPPSIGGVDLPALMRLIAPDGGSR